jgi:hypothetical protein
MGRITRNSMQPWDSHRLLLICGLHRSGTTLLHDMLSTSSEISGFRDTGVYGGEGQHVQTVYPIEDEFGGAGRMGFRPDIHLTESAPLVSTANREALFEQWSHYWDLSRPVLVEKTPANLLRSRFLQALYPTAHFVLITRHPVATVLATQKWCHTSLYALFEHWLDCHEIFDADRPHLNKALHITYEDLTSRPEEVVEGLAGFLGVEPWVPPSPRARINDRYFSEWKRLTRDAADRRKRRGSFTERAYRKMLRTIDSTLRLGYAPLDMCAEAADAEAYFERRLRKFGYSFTDI